MKTVKNEWLVANQIGSFAMGSGDRVPRRKYHSLLTIREAKRGEALNALLDTQEVLVMGDKRLPLDCSAKSIDFMPSPHPSWTYDFGNIQIERTVQIHPERDHVRVIYEIKKLKIPATLEISPWLLLRPIHHIKRENPFLNGTVRKEGSWFSLEPYPSVPKVYFRISGAQSEFQQGGSWRKGIFHEMEQERGYEAYDDAFVPGVLKVSLDKSTRFFFEFSTVPSDFAELTGRVATKKRSFVDQLNAAAQMYLVSTKSNLHSILAGFPWFEHWARDTFICIPGICLETGKTELAEKILNDYSDLFLKKGAHPSLNPTGCDSPFLFVRAVELLTKANPKKDFTPLVQKCALLYDQLRKGFMPSMEIQESGQVFVKKGPWASSWMDAMVDGNPVTPRHGYAVDINALFLQGLHFLLNWAKKSDMTFYRNWDLLLERGRTSFVKTFVREEFDFLADCHDGEKPCFELRPNQLWAFSSNLSLVPQEMAKRALARIRAELLTPVGLRTLSPKGPKYRGVYQGTQRERDFGYHQGPVWPWTLGIYMDALTEVYGLERAKSELKPILEHLETHLNEEACLGQISELFDGDEPHIPRGAPAQAFSVAEVFRVAKKVLK